MTYALSAWYAADLGPSGCEPEGQLEGFPQLKLSEISGCTYQSLLTHYLDVGGEGFEWLIYRVQNTELIGMMFSADESLEFLEELWHTNFMSVSAALVQQFQDNDSSTAGVPLERLVAYYFAMASMWKDMLLTSRRNDENDRFAIKAIEGNLTFLLESTSSYETATVPRSEFYD